MGPVDSATVVESVRKTGRLVIAEPGHRMCGAGAEIAATIAEEAQEALRAPIRRLAAPNMQIPFSPALEAQLYPTTEKIVAAVRSICPARRMVEVKRAGA